MKVENATRLAAMVVARVLAGSLALALAGAAFAQEPPLALRFTAFASRDFTDTPRQYDLMQTLLELAPGAAIPSHRVNGRGLVTVLSGEVTRVEEDGSTTVFKAGQTFPETIEDEFDVDVNRGTTPARLLVTFLLAPGAEPLIFNPNAPPSTAPGPTFVAVARTTVGTIPGQFTLTHGMFDVPPGWRVGLHTHDGWSIVTSLNGNVTNRVNGVVQPPSFAHGPMDVHDGEYTGSSPVTSMFASVGPTGAPPSRPLTTSAQQQTAAQTRTVTPPATGDGGLGAPAEPISAWVYGVASLTAAGLAIGGLRVAQRRRKSARR